MPIIVPDVKMITIGDVYRSWPQENWSMIAEHANYVLTGQNVQLDRTRKVIASTGMFSLNGQNAGLIRPGTLPFPLPESNFVAPKRPLQRIYPRPDSETASWARHRKAYFDGVNQVQYRIPVGVSFGSWPYMYTVISGPPGLTVGSYYGDVNYGIVTWTPSSSVLNTTVTIRVTDQTGAYIDVTWTVSTSNSTSDFIFVGGSGASDSNNGAIGTPLSTVQGAMTTSYANRIVYVKNGTYAGDIDFGASSRPMALLNYPGNSPVLNMSGANVRSAGSTSDVFIQGITFSGGDISSLNYRTIYFGGVYPRQTFHDLRFTNIVNGTVANDNPTSIFFESDTSLKRYIYIADCQETNRPVSAGGNSAGLFVAFTMADSLFERNRITGSNAGQGNLTLKASCQNNCVRNNYIQANSSVQGFALGSVDQVDYGIIPMNNEWCYNVVDSRTFGAIALNYRIQTSTSPGQCWVYRNTFYGDMFIRSPLSTNGPFTLERNVVVVNSGNPLYTEGGNPSLIVNTGNECQGLVSTGIINTSTMTLQGTYRTNWLGKRGAEIA